MTAELTAASTVEVALRELPSLTQVGLRVDPAHLALPAPNTVAVDGDRRTLWLGPDEWLVVDAPGRAGALVAELEAATAGAFATVVDLSANRTTFELTGPGAPDVLAQGCAIDLHPRAFGPGRCAQTLLGRANVVLDQVDAAPTYRLLVRPSFAAYVADWLADAIAWR